MYFLTIYFIVVSLSKAWARTFSVWPITFSGVLLLCNPLPRKGWRAGLSCPLASWPVQSWETSPCWENLLLLSYFPLLSIVSISDLWRYLVLFNCYLLFFKNIMYVQGKNSVASSSSDNLLWPWPVLTNNSLFETKLIILRPSQEWSCVRSHTLAFLSNVLTLHNMELMLISITLVRQDKYNS